MKLTMTGVSTEQVQQMLTLLTEMPSVQLLMENESQPYIMTTNLGTTVTYANGLSRHDTAVATKKIEGYWIYRNDQGVARLIHLIKKKNRDGTAITYCGIAVSQDTVDDQNNRNLSVCHICSDSYNG